MTGGLPDIGSDSLPPEDARAVELMLSRWQSTSKGGALDSDATLCPDEAGTVPFTGVGAGLFTGFTPLPDGQALQCCLQRAVELKTSAAYTRLKTVARLQGRLEHPNIVPVHVLETSADGTLLLALRALPGISWQERLAAEDEAVEAHLRILLQVCQGVAFAHSHAVLHLDLKPSHVRLGAFGEVQLGGWELALDRSAELRRPICGTPAYLAPEQAREEELGVATDIYQLGGILYHILTGRPPREGSPEQVARAAVSGTLPALSAIADPELRQICARALAEAAEQRFGSVLELRAALEEHLAHAASRRRSAQAGQELTRCRERSDRARSSRERGQLYDAFARALAGFEQARLLWTGNPGAAAGLSAGRRAFARAALQHGDLLLAEQQLALAAASAEAEADPATGELQAALLAAQHAERHALRTRRRLRATLVGLAGVLLCGYAFWTNQLMRDQHARAQANDSLRVELAHLERERDRSRAAELSAAHEKAAAEQAERVAAAASSQVHGLLWTTVFHVRDGLLHDGNTAILRTTSEELLALIERLNPGDLELTAVAWANAAYFQYLSGALASAQHSAGQAVALARARAASEPGAGTHMALAAILVQCASVAHASGHPGDAVTLYQESLALVEGVLTQQSSALRHEAAAEGARGLALALDELGQPEAATRAMERALRDALSAQRADPQRPPLKKLEIQIDLSELLAPRDPDAALALLQTLQAESDTLRSRFPAELALDDLDHELARKLAEAYFARGLDAQAWPQLERALRLADELVARDPDRLRARARRLETLRQFGWRLGYEGRLDEAEAVYRAALEEARQTSADTDRLEAVGLVARLDGELAAVLVRARRLAEARVLVEEGIGLLRPRLNPASALETRLALVALLRQHAELARWHANAAAAQRDLLEAQRWLQPDLDRGRRHVALLYHAANLQRDRAQLADDTLTGDGLAARRAADSLFVQLFELAPEHREAWREAIDNRLKLAEALLAPGEAEEALALVEACGDALAQLAAASELDLGQERFLQQRSRARCLVALERLPEALLAYAEALKMLETSHDAPGSNAVRDWQLRTRGERADLLLELGQVDEAVAELRRCVELRRQDLAQRGDDFSLQALGFALGELSLVLAGEDRHEEALEAAWETCELNRALLARRPHPQTWWNLSLSCETAALALEALGELEQALPLAEEAIESAAQGARASPSPRWLDQRLRGEELRARLWRTLEPERALPGYLALVADLDQLQRQTGDPDDWRRWVEASLALAELYDEAGRAEEGTERLQALRARSADRALDDPDAAGEHADVLRLLARRQLDLGQPEAAAEILTACVEACERWAAPYPEDPLSVSLLARTRAELAEVLWTTGEAEHARQLLEQASRDVEHASLRAPDVELQALLERLQATLRSWQP